MAGLRLTTSNRLENLADTLAEALRQPMRRPLQPDVIVVQSQGMARWLKLELARRNGVWANGEFPFPNAFCRQVFARILPGFDADSPFERAVMAWKIMGLLPRLADRTDFAEVSRYLRSAPDPRKTFHLAVLATLAQRCDVHCFVLERAHTKSLHRVGGVGAGAVASGILPDVPGGFQPPIQGVDW